MVSFTNSFGFGGLNCAKENGRDVTKVGHQVVGYQEIEKFEDSRIRLDFGQ
jgi:hypothetical protein